MDRMSQRRLTSINLAAEHHAHIPDSSLDHGTILRAIVDNFVLSPFDFFTGCWIPLLPQNGQDLKFIAWNYE